VEPVAHSASVSRGSARLSVDLSDGSKVTIALSGGTIYVNDKQAGTYERGGAMERTWRAMLSKAGELTTPQLVFALRSLPSGLLGPGTSEAMAVITGALPAVGADALGGPPPDVTALAAAHPVNLDSINELAGEVAGRAAAASCTHQAPSAKPGSSSTGPPAVRRNVLP